MAGYRKITGMCRGNGIISLKASKADCANQCNSRSECAGWTYVESGEREWKGPQCFLKSQMCAKGRSISYLIATSYIKTAGEGKSSRSILLTNNKPVSVYLDTMAHLIHLYIIQAQAVQKELLHPRRLPPLQHTKDQQVRK